MKSSVPPPLFLSLLGGAAPPAVESPKPSGRFQELVQQLFGDLPPSGPGVGGERDATPPAAFTDDPVEAERPRTVDGSEAMVALPQQAAPVADERPTAPVAAWEWSTEEEAPSSDVEPTTVWGAHLAPAAPLEMSPPMQAHEAAGVDTHRPVAAHEMAQMPSRGAAPVMPAEEGPVLQGAPTPLAAPIPQTAAIPQTSQTPQVAATPPTDPTPQAAPTPQAVPTPHVAPTPQVAPTPLAAPIHQAALASLAEPSPVAEAPSIPAAEGSSPAHAAPVATSNGLPRPDEAPVLARATAATTPSAAPSYEDAVDVERPEQTADLGEAPLAAAPDGPPRKVHGRARTAYRRSAGRPVSMPLEGQVFDVPRASASPAEATVTLDTAVAMSAPAEVPELPVADLDGVVHLEIDEEVSVDVSLQGEQVRVEVESTRDAASVLEGLGDELSSELARDGQSLDYRHQQRREADARRPASRDISAQGSAPSAPTDDGPEAPQPRHTGVVHRVA